MHNSWGAQSSSTTFQQHIEERETKSTTCSFITLHGMRTPSSTSKNIGL